MTDKRATAAASGTFTFKPPTAQKRDKPETRWAIPAPPILQKSGTDSEQDPPPLNDGEDGDDTSVAVVVAVPKQKTTRTKKTTSQEKVTPAAAPVVRQPAKKKGKLVEKEDNNAVVVVPEQNPTAKKNTSTSQETASATTTTTTVIPSSSAAVAATRDTTEADLVARIVVELNDIISRAAQPLLTFVGMIAVKLRENDVRNLLAWPAGPNGATTSIKERLQIVEPAKTMAEFIAKNRELGSTLLGMYMNAGTTLAPLPTAATPSPINACFDLDDLERIDAIRRSADDDLDQEIQRLEIERQQQLLAAVTSNQILRLEQIDTLIRARKEAKLLRGGINALMGGDVELKFAPAWAFQVMGDAVFRRILSISTLAAIEASAAAVRRIPNCSSFTVKELICSPQVSDQFAFLVSASYLSSGDGIPPAQRGAGRGGNRNTTYLNVHTMRQQLASKIYACNVWFETGVSRRTHPLRSAFSEQCVRKRANIAPRDLASWEARMAAYLEAMPRYELVFNGDY
jgi:hypothetical protein